MQLPGDAPPLFLKSRGDDCVLEAGPVIAFVLQVYPMTRLTRHILAQKKNHERVSPVE